MENRFRNLLHYSLLLQKFLLKQNLKIIAVTRPQYFGSDNDIAQNQLIIGQVVAEAGDKQILRYSIIHGNEEELFVLNSATGEDAFNMDLKSSVNQSIALVVEVTDNDVNPLMQLPPLL